MTSLDKYLAQQDEDEAREEAILDLSAEIEIKLKRGGFYQPSTILNTANDYWHMDDFIADVCIDNAYMISMLKGKPQGMMEDMQEKFEAFCIDAARKSFDKEMEMRNEQ